MSRPLARAPPRPHVKGLPASSGSWRGLSCHPVTMPRHAPRHPATTPSPANMPRLHATAPPSQRESLAISRAWLGPYHNKYYPWQAFWLSALAPPSPCQPRAAATAEPRGWGRRHPPACSNPTLSHKLFKLFNTLAPTKIKILCNSVSYVRTT